MAERPRKFWGWGYEDETLDEAFIVRVQQLLRLGLGVPEFTPIPAPRLEAIGLRLPRIQLPADLARICSDAALERVSHCYGKSYRDVIRGLRGQFDNPPDFVAYPTDETELMRLMAFCESKTIALIPYGGGSSVVGGVEPTACERYQGVITVDLKHFDRILAVDTESRAARIQAGILGPALEAGLKGHGLTLRHFPQSFEFSSLGGWIATRSAGHFASMYTHIDDFVQSIRMVTPRGILETRRLPASGAGPSPERLILGSEGILGIITEAWVRVQSIPAYRSSVTISFRHSADGLRAVRAISQSGLFPANCRLVSALEALSMGLGDGEQTILILGFESHDHSVDAWMSRALELCAQFNGKWDMEPMREQSSKDGSPADQWRKSFLQAPYLRDYLASCGLVVETFETAVTWDRFESFHRAVIQAVQHAIETHCGRGFITWRLTHIYPDGAAPYYTVIAVAERDREIEQWDKIKDAAATAILEQGGTITHHHAVGKDHRRWYEQERSPLFGVVLASAKRTLDPNWILNPDVLLTVETPQNRGHT